MRSAFSSAVGFVCALLLTFVFAGCEDDALLPPGFSFDASLPPIDAAFVDAGSDAGPPETTFTSTPAAISKEATARFEFVSSQPGGSFACQLDDGTPAPCVSPNSFPVSEGVHTFKVSAVSAISASAVDLSPASFTWTVDLTAPKTTLTKSPPALDNTKAAKFEFTVSEPGTTTCSVDGAAAAPCTSPFTTSELADGQHTVTIVATDVAGNLETPAKTHTWTLDTTTPDTTIVLGPTGAVNAKTATFTFSSTAGEGATYACSLDAAGFTACTSPVELTGLAEGEHTFRVRSSSAANNQDITPDARTWTVDTVPPSATISGGPSGAVNDSTPTFTFTAAGATTIECGFAEPFAACTSPFTATTALGEGAHTFTVKATDAAGNTASTERKFTVDTINPGVTINAGPNGPTKDNTPTFTFTHSGGATGSECRIDTAAFATCSTSFTSGILIDGAHTFEVRVTDAAGNLASASRNFTVDTIAPTVAISGGPSGPTNDTTPTFDFSAVGAATTECRFGSQPFAPCTSPFTAAELAPGSYTFEVRASDAATNTASTTRPFSIDTAAPSITINSGPNGPTKVAAPSFTFTAGADATKTRCRIDAAPFADCTSPFTAATLSNAEHTFEVEAIDAAGNTGAASRAFTVDTIAPTASVTGGPNGPTNVTNPEFTFTVGGSPTTTQCRINTGPYTSCTSPFTVTELAEGSYTFEVRVVDAATNASSATRAFSIDTTLPSVSITAGPTAWSTTATPEFTFTSGEGAILTHCRVDAAAFDVCTSPFTTGTLTNAPHTFDVRAFDAAGNFATDSRAFTVDTVAPGVTILEGPGSPTSDSTPSVYFSVTGATSIRCAVDGATFGTCTSPFTPASLLDGEHTIFVRGTDAATNSTTRSVTFIVDTTGPVVTITSGPSGPTRTIPTFTFTATGNPDYFECSEDNESWNECTSPYSFGDGVEDGNYTFRVRAYDALGNRGATVSRSFRVDTQTWVSIEGGPEGAMWGESVEFALSAEELATVQCRWVYVPGEAPEEPRAWFPCAPPTVNTIAPSGQYGSWRFEAVATDAAGNEASSSTWLWLWDNTQR